MSMTSEEMKAKAFVVLRAIVRLVWVLLSNMYSIPAHLVMVAVLLPLKTHAPELYNFIDGLSFRWLQCLVAHWMYSAGYKVAECGDDLSELEDEETLMMANHQSTADVPALMYALQFHGRVLDNIMWIMDVMFYHSNFGWISRMRGDFFIQQGKETRALQGALLRTHIKDSYIPRDRKWIVVFPEGHFFWKQKKSSQAYGRKNGLPHLEHCLLPRVGAVHAVMQTLAPQNNNKDINPLDQKEKVLKWIVDVTIAYPKGVPLNLLTVFAGQRQPMVTTMHYRKFPINQVPVEQDKLLIWLCDRAVEKDRLLDTFYKTGKFPASEGAIDSFCKPLMLELSAQRRFGLHFFYLFLTYCELYFMWSIVTSLWSAICFVL